MNQILTDVRDSLQRLDAAAAIDILLIAAIIYALLMALRGTTAMTLLRGGVVIICVLFLLGRILELSVVNFLVRNSLPGLVLGVIVIFQPEIRRALERAGRTSMRRWLSNTEQDMAIAEVSAAIAELSHLRHGAIVVMERSTGLEDYIESGVRIDAGLNAKLIEGIFFPNSPLHDKALIIRDQRIVAASCTLPVASGAGASRLGMRHRAALGVSEQTDAIAIVVSEETGAISVASEGRLIPLRDDTRVRSTLEALASRRTGLRPAAQAS
ncbi:MAG: TIGR00159 family protein [Dehalococcoidia bacterium]|nr:TIGR00159 family protein [Dehalococcoidia bacterium]